MVPRLMLAETIMTAVCSPRFISIRALRCYSLTNGMRWSMECVGNTHRVFYLDIFITYSKLLKNGIGVTE